MAGMVKKFNVSFREIKSKMDTVNFEESLDPYSAFRKASEDSTIPDQPMWGLLVWQVVGIFLLGFVIVCAVSCYCCERYSVRIPKVKKQLMTSEEDPEDACVALTRKNSGDWEKIASPETDC